MVFQIGPLPFHGQRVIFPSLAADRAISLRSDGTTVAWDAKGEKERLKIGQPAAAIAVGPDGAIATFGKDDTPVAPQAPAAAPQQAPARNKASRAKEAPAAKETTETKNARAGSKTGTILALIKQSGGATLNSIMEATQWQAHTVRGFISGTLGKKMGLTVNSAKREDGTRVYSIAKYANGQ